MRRSRKFGLKKVVPYRKSTLFLFDFWQDLSTFFCFFWYFSSFVKKCYRKWLRSFKKQKISVCFEVLLTSRKYLLFFCVPKGCFSCVFQKRGAHWAEVVTFLKMMRIPPLPRIYKFEKIQSGYNRFNWYCCRCSSRGTVKCLAGTKKCKLASKTTLNFPPRSRCRSR